MTTTKPEPLCIQWKRAAQDQIYAETKDFTPEDWLAHFEQLNRKYIPGYAAQESARETQLEAEPTGVQPS